MDNITNTGNATAIFQVGIKLDSGQLAEFSLHGQEASAFSAQTVYREEANAPGRSDSVFTTANSGFVNRLLAASMSSGTPEVQVRFGMGNLGSYWWSPWQLHAITEFVAVPKSIGANDGYMVRLSTADYLVKISRSKKVQSHKGKISDLVAAIAEANRIPATVIEPTVGRYALVQSYESDTSFVLRRLLMRAVNAKGQGNFRLFFKDGALHFHTPDFQTEVHTLDYFNRSSGIELYQTDRSQAQLHHGAAKVSVMSFDPLTGETTVVTSKDDRLLRLGSATPKLGSVPGADLNLLMHVGQNLAADNENYAQAKYEHEHAGLYEMELLTTKTPTIRVGSILNIVVQAADQSSPWSGMYLVSGVRHTIDCGSLVSRVLLHRGEMNKSGGASFKEMPVYDSAVLTSETSSPGHLVSPESIMSSTRSQGIESNTLRTINDPGLPA